jgi:hypothetical protein
LEIRIIDKTEFLSAERLLSIGSVAVGNSDCMVGMVGSALRSITSAQCQRHVRRLARQLIFIVFNSKESERSFK